MNRAYFYAPMTRPLCIKIPDEDWEERDAAQKWAATNTKFMVKIGFQRGRAFHCNFVHKKRNIKMTVHGDDFLAVADLDQIKWIEEQLKSEYGTKAEVLGPEQELSKEIKILNRSIRWCGDKLENEADSRHADLIIEECEVQSCRATKTPWNPGSRGGWKREGWNRDERSRKDEVPWSCREDQRPCHGPQRPSVCGKGTLS